MANARSLNSRRSTLDLVPEIGSCHNPEILKACKDWGRWSKHDNGCQAYAQGWKAGTYSCHNCGKVSKDYMPCNLKECRALCVDLYSKCSDATLCSNGCEYYSGLITEGWYSVTLECAHIGYARPSCVFHSSPEAQVLPLL